MSSRSYSSPAYRYGFNGQEKDDEVSGSGNTNTAEYWEYDPRIVTRWNRDPITFPWQSPYDINNNNPIVFTDPLGLFGSRKEAREYKKEHGLKGRIQKGDDGIFSINDKKGGASYYRDHSLDDVPNVLGRQDDGVIKSILVSADEPGPSTGASVDGAEEYGKRGGFDLRKKHINKNAYESTKYFKQEFGIKIKPSTVTSGAVNLNKGLTKGLVKHAPLIGYILDAKEVLDGIQADGNALGANTAIEVAGVAGGASGAWAGAAGGAAIGSLIFPGVGTVIGGAVGAILGSWGGEEAAEAVTRKAVGE